MSLSDQRSGRRKASQFHSYATALAADLSRTTSKLAQLTALAQSKSLFNDPSAQIEELTFIVKQDLSMLQARLEDLQSLTRSDSSPGNDQQHTHCENVVASINSSLLDTTKEFHSVLQRRTKSMKQQDERRSKFSHGATSAGGVSGAARSPFSVAARAGDGQKRIGAADIEDGSQTPAMAQQLVSSSTHEQAYFHSRAEAMRNIESTISEISGMFQQLATMVAEQQHQVERIDRDIEDTLHNVEAGQNELTKYFKNISSNRTLLLKVFGVLLFFIIFWTVFVL